MTYARALLPLFFVPTGALADITQRPAFAVAYLDPLIAGER